MSINFGQFPTPRLPIVAGDFVVGYQLVGSVPTLAQYTMTQLFGGLFPGGIVPIVNGGTGASTAPQALTNLGAASLLTNTFAGNQSIVVPNATLNIDDSNGGSSANINFKSQNIPQWEIRSVAFNAFFLDRFVAGAFVNSPISVDQASGTVNLPLVGITGGSVNGATVGAATPSTGAFTTLAATSTVSGAGFVARFAAPGPIGSTTPSTVAATTITASGTITPAQVAGIVGTTTNNNAQTGSTGEFVTATASGVALASGTPANVTSISLTAGDWDVSGVIAFGAAVTTVYQIQASSISTTSATAGPLGNTANINNVGTGAAGAGSTVATPNVRVSLSATTTVFLVAIGSFTLGTASASGVIRARRMR